jgi:Bacteriophage lambda head decoration protein D
MAAPIRSAAHIPAARQLNSGPATKDFIISDSGNLSYDVIQLPQGAAGLWPGTFITAAGVPVAAAGEATIAGITCYAYNVTDGPVNATVLTRDAEVVDAYLQYGALDVAAVNTRLAALGIIVRPGVLKNVQPASFAPDVPPSGPPSSGIQMVEGEELTRREGESDEEFEARRAEARRQEEARRRAAAAALVRRDGESEADFEARRQAAQHPAHPARGTASTRRPSPDRT